MLYLRSDLLMRCRLRRARRTRRPRAKRWSSGWGSAGGGGDCNHFRRALHGESSLVATLIVDWTPPFIETWVPQASCSPLLIRSSDIPDFLMSINGPDVTTSTQDDALISPLSMTVQGNILEWSTLPLPTSDASAEFELTKSVFGPPRPHHQHPLRRRRGLSSLRAASSLCNSPSFSLAHRLRTFCLIFLRFSTRFLGPLFLVS